jgi:hypothetical protein
MASGTVIPVPKMQFFDNNGAALAGGKLYCYASGTTTHQAVYSDAALTSALSQPVTLDSSGRATIFLQAKAYKFTLKTSADVELWTQDNVFALQPSESMNLELTGTAGETLAANNVVYLSDGSGSKTAGRWYKADADNTYSSTEPKIGLATAAISTGATGLIRIGGTMDGFSSLTLGAKQYVSATAGALTETAPTNAKVVGWAMSATEVVIDPESMANSLAQTFKVMASSPYNLTWPAADAAGLLKSNGSGVLSFATDSSSKIELVHESSGTNSTISDNNFVTYDLGGALNMNVYFLILWQLYPQSANTNDPRLYLTNTSTQCGVMTEANITAGTPVGGLSFLGPMARGSATAWTSWSVGGHSTSGYFTSMTSWTASTTKQIAIRGYPQSGGTCGWSWNIYKVSPITLL